MPSATTHPSVEPGQIYSLDFFSGSQAVIYIGDVYIDEIVSLRYEVRQRKTPIYGYASQLFDTVAPGPVIVEGGLTINFKESGYLWATLARYKALEIVANRAIEAAGGHTRISTEPQGAYRRELIAAGAPDIAEALRQTSPEADAMIERIVTGRSAPQERSEFFQGLAGWVNEVAAPRRQAFQDLVDRFEEKVWGANTADVSVLDDQSRRVDSNIFDNVDIFLTFGDVTNPEVSSTVRRIRGVHFTSQGQEINADGQPLLEFYSFLARTIL